MAAYYYYLFFLLLLLLLFFYFFFIFNYTLAKARGLYGYIDGQPNFLITDYSYSNN